MLKLSFIIFLFAGINTFGQQEQSYFLNHLSAKNGLTSGNIRKISEDTKGFIWIATQDGLFRYDSRSFLSFNAYSEKPHKIGGADVRDLQIDSSSHSLWLTTSYGGINEIDINTGVVVDNVTQNEAIFGKNNLITSLAIYKNKVFIATKAGLFLYNKNSKNVSPVNLKYGKANLNIFPIDKIVLLKNKIVLFSKENIYLYDISKNTCTQHIIADSVIRKSVSNFAVYDVATNQANSCFLATSKGLAKIEVSSFDSLIFTAKPFPFKITDIECYAACFDKNNQLWISNSQSTIRINPYQNTYTYIKENKSKDEWGWLSSTYHLFCDSRNIIWFGGQEGLAYTINNPAAFVAYSKAADSETRIRHAYYLNPVNDSILYACAEEGIYKVHLADGKIDIIDNSKSYDFIFFNNYNAIVSNNDGMFVLRNKKLYPIKNVYPEFNAIEQFRINSCISLNDSCKVMGTEDNNGIIIWDHKKHSVENYTTHSKKITLKEDMTNQVVYIDNNRFAILSDGYFSILNYDKKNIEYFDLKDKSGKSYSIFFDLAYIKGLYYLASYGKGVIVLNKRFEVLDEISKQNGLSNTGVYKLIPWRDSILFISTNNGLNAYNIKTKKIKQYYESDGLQADAFEETSGIGQNNMLYFGGTNGFTALYPENIISNTTAPPLFFNRIKIDIPDNKFIDTSDLQIKSVSIPSNALQTTINFSGINFSNPNRMVYAYRIIEKSKEWITLSTQNFVTLIGLSPGTYHLQVKAANEDGIWSEPKELILTYIPKWYQTWWFKLLVFLATTGIIYAFYRYRISQIKKQHQIRKNIATDLHDDLGSTLNSVKVFTNLAISGVKQEESLQQVKDNLNEATMGLRDMIWVLDDSLDTVDELVTRLKQYAIPVAQASNIETIIKAESDINNRQLSKEEKRNLFLVCKEAINNSLKYAQASQINIDITGSGKKIQIIIADNGIGFNADEVKKGYGLKNMQYRAGQIKYKVNLLSEPGKGTKISIQPL